MQLKGLSLAAFTLLALAQACAGSNPAPKSAAEASEPSFAERTRAQWTREDQQRQQEERTRGFASGSSDRSPVQAQP